jgi:hypothetical protein
MSEYPRKTADNAYHCLTHAVVEAKKWRLCWGCVAMPKPGHHPVITLDHIGTGYANFVDGSRWPSCTVMVPLATSAAQG